MTKHNLMDIEIVIRRTAVFSLLTAVLSGFFVAIVLVGGFFLGSRYGQFSLWMGAMAAFLVVLLFQPLRSLIQILVDRLFFRARYNYQQIVTKYSYSLTQSMTDINRFSQLTPYVLVKAMQLSGAAVMTLDREAHAYFIRGGEGEMSPYVGKTVPEDSAVIQALAKTHKELLQEEVEGANPPVAKQMKELKANLIIPSISESGYFKTPTLLSTINLGKKQNNESFSREDISFLRTIANQTRVSLEYAFVMDELKREQQKLLRSEKLAAIGSTAAGIAHELKNPLSYISTVSQILPQKWEDKEFRSMIEDVLPSEVERMKLIIDGLLGYSREKELKLAPLDIRQVIEKTIALISYEVRKNNVKVDKQYNHGNTVNGDSNRLMQVFVNIMGNAVQAMEKSGGELTVSTSDEPGFVKIMIADTGPGIPRENLEKIFDPFFSTKESGTGLGLPITKKIVEEHCGRIAVASIVGKGTVFTILLPAIG